jgi:uncharacterized SAM-binding protein YcdF (DUF218 family)
MRPRFRHQGGFAYIQILIVIAVVALIWWQRAALLAPLGTFLNVGEAPSHAEVILVLAGGLDGGRILKAGELVRAGFATYALVSGPHSYYDQPECSAALPFAVRKGYPSEYFQCATINAKSTEEEAKALVPELQRRQVKKLIVVSVDTHLRRARGIYRRQLPAGMEAHFVASESPGFRLSEWWRAREGRKAVLLEWTKLISSQIGI